MKKNISTVLIVVSLLGKENSQKRSFWVFPEWRKKQSSFSADLVFIIIAFFIIIFIVIIITIIYSCY